MAPLLHSGYNLTLLYCTLCIRGPQLEMARPPHSKYLCVTTLWPTSTAALRNRVMQTCPTILVKCCLVRNFCPPPKCCFAGTSPTGRASSRSTRSTRKRFWPISRRRRQLWRPGASWRSRAAPWEGGTRSPSSSGSGIDEKYGRWEMKGWKTIFPGFSGGKRQHPGRIRRRLQGIRQMEGLSARRSRTRRNDAGEGRWEAESLPWEEILTFWLQRCWRRALVWWRASRAERR